MIGVANKMHYLRRSWTLPNDLQHDEASFSTISMDMLPDLAIFVLTTTDKTDYFTPCTCVWGKILILSRNAAWLDVGLLVISAKKPLTLSAPDVD